MSVFGVFSRVFPHSAQIRIQPKCGKIRTRKIPITKIFYAVILATNYHSLCTFLLLFGTGFKLMRRYY